ncbi:hypothetical protein DCAR_0729300 [Daucus carota subsp. sativus]|uniref:MAPK kinase substrate protein n=1 Tax=Daucus carota subsp. sativus TaxID=79200 RepID=A0AAF0XNU3_DAUCS|nr:PREDICTED: uncharacterized protein At1g15400-like [Daucus carota subsp. sativus]WOH09841.1 hypothetical protein DCAR_0729300 [Daucus carota subsp. sativus]
MEGLQRSAVSFRRQGSSGLIWDDNLLKAEIDRFDQRKANQDQADEEAMKKEDENDAVASVEKVKDEIKPIKTGGSGSTMERSRSNGGRAYRTGKVSPAIDPPSPKVSACGFCGGAFGKRKEARAQRKPRSGKRKV